MKTLITLIAAGGLAAATFAQQPNQPPKPGPEHQKFALWFGDWTYEGQYETTPLGLGGTFTGRMTGRPILDGFGGEYVFVENGPSGETRTVEIDGYDPVAKSYPYVAIGNDRSLFQGSYTMNGSVATWEGISVVSGKRVRERGIDAVASDGQSFTKRWEISEDGKTWVPSGTLKATKLLAAPATDLAAEQAAIRALFERHRLALESKNLAAVSRTFDRTGPLVVAFGEGEPMTDWPIVERAIKDWFGATDEIRMKDNCLQVRVHSSGLAAWASYLTDETVTSNGLSTTEHLRATFGLEKQGQSWVVVQAHWSELHTAGH